MGSLRSDVCMGRGVEPETWRMHASDQVGGGLGPHNQKPDLIAKMFIHPDSGRDGPG